MTFANIKHFKSREFDSPDMPGSGAGMSRVFVEKLDLLRSMLGRPLKINSGLRTQAHNKRIGGKPASAHLEGLAADISCKESRKRLDIVRLALKLGIHRIGIGKTFIHLDNSRTLPQRVMWLY